ncbi:hypothetical protein M3689_07420 [Alkalihalophilus marmarensis]|uniref:Uncharacterized protein n=1 Tax=Alkalihalophilus marmarensis DSM 21297 TaxID=1188261 RepID=U6SND4_9BACI|nr:hypothetical protein [Alkalihalophilus marmarensis]ERN52867.1 hypothetical protein A33I_14385 [Alkalihalophilus marmarensis DSM 21297]MCM3489122.1 hypothetical protein [Alkalihalophilus marmarensis]
MKQDTYLRLTPVQLQQRLIYTQSELKKYKLQVEKYKNDYYYNLIDQLKKDKENLENEIQLNNNELFEKESLYNKEINSLKNKLGEAEQKIILLEEKLLTVEKKLEDSNNLLIKEKRSSEDISHSSPINHSNSSSSHKWFEENIKSQNHE